MAIIFQVSDSAFIVISKIPGSLCYLIRRCYRESESPTGWYSEGEPQYISAKNPTDAAAIWLEGRQTPGKERGDENIQR